MNLPYFNIAIAQSLSAQRAGEQGRFKDKEVKLKK